MSAEQVELDKNVFFVNDELKFVNEMSDAELEARIRELAELAIESKLRYGAADSVKRKRNAEKTSKQREWLLSPDYNDPNVTNAINVVETRKKRQSKGDKQLELLRSLGVENAEEIVSNMMGKAKETAVNAFTFNNGSKSKPLTSELCRIERHTECNGSFKTGEVSNKCNCECHKVKPKVSLGF